MHGLEPDRPRQPIALDDGEGVALEQQRRRLGTGSPVAVQGPNNSFQESEPRVKSVSGVCPRFCTALVTARCRDAPGGGTIGPVMRC
jgi:hypothetical protein